MTIRKSNHFTCARRGDKATFYMAIRKYGKENFKWEIIDKANTREELDLKESFWIDFFNTYKHGGYNMTLGGQKEKDYYIDYENSEKYNCNNRYKRKIMVFDKLGNYIKTVVNQTDFAEEINVGVGNINRVLNGKKNSIGGYIMLFEDEFTQEKLDLKLNKTRNTREFAIFDIHLNKWIGKWINMTRCSEDTDFSYRMIEKQLGKEVKRPRRFMAKYLINCTDYEIEQINKVMVKN